MYNFSQAQIFTIFFIIGVLISILFDFFRALRKSIKTPDTVTIIEDIIYLLIAGTIVVTSILKINSGEVRLYIFMAIFLRNSHIFFDNQQILCYNFLCNSKFM